MTSDAEKVLEYIKKKPQFTPGEISKKLKWNNYARASAAIDELASFGLVNHGAHTWQSDPIKYTPIDSNPKLKVSRITIPFGPLITTFVATWIISVLAYPNKTLADNFNSGFPIVVFMILYVFGEIFSSLKNRQSKKHPSATQT